ncbi:unnamed protein product [Gongylonema pulchrum]|uniref:MADF domain-containing protein n=1 Tax=Gongylonema pulchrum TaxID=637853 RepID=A0A183E3E9_9BILA|nr:unnamed protein product [Gongylonema pulchrum]
MTNETVVWTDSMREVLIKSVQRQECIWNFSNADYRNAAKKRQIFWDIAEEMSAIFGIPLKGTHTSRQWQHLRDQYRRAKRRMELSNVNGQIKPWRFMQMLKFTDATDIAEANDPM